MTMEMETKRWKEWNEKIKACCCKRWGTGVALSGVAVALVALGLFAPPFQELEWKGWFSLAVITVLLFALVHEVAPTHVLFATALGVLVLFQCVDSEGALAGFSNQGISTITVLFIVAAAITRTNSLMLLCTFFTSTHRKHPLRSLLAKLCIPLGAASMFLNSTPIYVSVLPVLSKIVKSTGIAPSKVMMPVSISLILGGTLSLIGNMNNLLVASLAVDDVGLVDIDGQPLRFGYFGISKVGSMYFAVGLLYVLLLAPTECMLPSRHKAELATKNVRLYLLFLKVTGRAKMTIGCTVGDLQRGVSTADRLVELHRGEEVLLAPGQDVVILEGDTLVFHGQLETLITIYKSDGGLYPVGVEQGFVESTRLYCNLYEVAVSRYSTLLLGKAIREACFPIHFEGVVLAVTSHKGTDLAIEKPEDHVIEGGETLLIEARPSFYRQFARDQNFSTVHPLEGVSPPIDDWLHITASLIILAAVVAIPPTGIVSIWVTAIAGSMLLVASGCISLQDAYSAVDITLMLTIAFSFGVGAAVQQSGVGLAIANSMINCLSPLGPIGIIAAIYICVGLLTEVITNSGAVALFFPIVSSILKDGTVVGLNPYAACYALMLAGSASFITPIGHQLNLMAHAAGGYKYSDWLRFGLPLQIILGFVGVAGCYFFYKG